MIDPVELRAQARVVLSAKDADTPVPEVYILAALKRFFPEPVKSTEMMLALRWNEARGWAESRWNADDETQEWLLTERGRVKEGVA